MNNLTEEEEHSEGNEEQPVEEVEESEKSKVVETTEEWTMEGMSNSFAMSLQWVDRMCGITPSSRNGLWP